MIARLFYFFYFSFVYSKLPKLISFSFSFLKKLLEIVNHKHDIFDLGFSWGTINGKITPHLLPTFSLKTIGKGSQELLDKSNYWRVVDFRTHIPE